jgi:hypothetical protein
MLQQFALNCPYLNSFNAGGGWKGKGAGEFLKFQFNLQTSSKKLQQFGKTFRKSNSVNTACWIRVPVLQRV